MGNMTGVLWQGSNLRDCCRGYSRGKVSAIIDSAGLRVPSLLIHKRLLFWLVNCSLGQHLGALFIKIVDAGKDFAGIVEIAL